LQFCSYYEAVEAELIAAWRHCTTELEKAELRSIETFMSEIALDYSHRVTAAKAQEKRNRPWFRRGRRNPVVSGGRADGNGT